MVPKYKKKKMSGRKNTYKSMQLSKTVIKTISLNRLNELFHLNMYLRRLCSKGPSGRTPAFFQISRSQADRIIYLLKLQSGKCNMTNAMVPYNRRTYFSHSGRSNRLQ